MSRVSSRWGEKFVIPRVIRDMQILIAEAFHRLSIFARPRNSIRDSIKLITEFAVATASVEQNQNLD